MRLSDDQGEAALPGKQLHSHNRVVFDMEIVCWVLSLLGIAFSFVGLVWVFDPVLHIFKRKKSSANGSNHIFYRGKEQIE